MSEYMPAPEGNKNANKKREDIRPLIEAYILHRASGLSKKSFTQCDFTTVEKYLEDVEFVPLKGDLDKAEREGLKKWEKMGMGLADGSKKGNVIAWIFIMKNKYAEDWKDKQEIDHLNNGNSFNTLSDAELVSRLGRLFEPGKKG